MPNQYEFEMTNIEGIEGHPKSNFVWIDATEEIKCKECGKEIKVNDWVRIRKKISYPDTQSRTLTDDVFHHGCIAKGVASILALVKEINIVKEVKQ